VSLFFLLYRELEKRVQELEKHAQEMGRDGTQYSRGEAQYRDIFDAAKDTFLIFDMNGVIKEVNPAGCLMYGYSRDEMIGLTGGDIVHPDFQYLFKEFVEKASEGVIFSAESVDIRKDGTTFPIEVKGSGLTFKGEPHLLAVVRDVTERKRVEEALRESEEKYRRIYENSVVGFFESAPEGRFLHVNPALAKMLRYESPEDLVSSILDIGSQTYTNTSDRSRYHKALKANGYVEDFQFKARCKDGSEVWLSDSSRAHLDGDGEGIRYEGIVLDITERKRAEDVLHRSEAKYRSIYDNAQTAIFRTRLSDGKVLECNDRFAQTYGYDSREECMADYVTGDHYVDPGTRERMLAHLAEFGEVNDFEARFSQKDGGIVCTRFSARAYPEEGFLEGVGYDITREKNALEELRVSEEKYRSILESIEEGYYEVDIAGNFTFFNDSLCEMLGYAEDELMGMNYRKYTAGEGSESVYKTFNRVFMTGVPARGFDWEIIRKDGTRRSIEVSVSPRSDTEGTVAGFSGIVRDITEKRMLQFQLQRAQKMEALGLLAGGVAHDLNNILSGIVSYPELILMDLPEDSPLRKPMKTIHESGMRAAGVVSDLLTIARGVATGKETLNLNTIVINLVKPPAPLVRT